MFSVKVFLFQICLVCQADKMPTAHLQEEFPPNILLTDAKPLGTKAGDTVGVG